MHAECGKSLHSCLVCRFSRVHLLHHISLLWVMGTFSKSTGSCPCLALLFQVSVPLFLLCVWCIGHWRAHGDSCPNSQRSLSPSLHQTSAEHLLFYENRLLLNVLFVFSGYRIGPEIIHGCQGMS